LDERRKSMLGASPMLGCLRPVTRLAILVVLMGMLIA
jgi:hypothetical protein